MTVLSKIESTISSFLLGEEGKISKQSALSLGALLTGGVLATNIAQAAHSSTSTLEFTWPNIEKGIHTSAHSSAGGCGGCGGGCTGGGCIGCSGCGGGPGSCGCGCGGMCSGCAACSH